MSRNTSLESLQRIAKLKADLEMRRFAAFRAHVEEARRRIRELEDELDALYRAEHPFSVSEARLANALAGERSRALLNAENELNRVLPGYERARQDAAREFGRTEAIRALRDKALAETRLDQRRRGNG